VAKNSFFPFLVDKKTSPKTQILRGGKKSINIKIKHQ